MISIHNNSDLSDFDALGLVRSVIGAVPQNQKDGYSSTTFSVNGKVYLVEVATTNKTRCFYIEPYAESGC